MQSARFLLSKRALLSVSVACVLGMGNSISHAQSTTIEEIVVTAQKRAENVQDVPIAISALTGDTLEQLVTRNLSDVGRFTSGVEFNVDKALQPVYNIRGIQTNDFTVGSDPAVTIYVDGVYTARGGGAEAALADVNRVEVLKGPQGTLFGRNATGGAIHIVSNAPTFEQEGKVKLVLGSEGRTDVEFVYNQPLTENLAVRLAAVTRNRDGIVDSVTGGDFNDEEHDAYRLSVLWNPSEDTEILLRLDGSRLDQNSAAQFTLIPEVFEAANPGLSFQRFGDGGHDLNNIEERDMFGASLEVNHDIGDMTLTSITGWREFETTFIEDVDGSNNPNYFFGTSNPDDNDYFSQEFRLVGASDDMKWTLGATYTKEHVDRTTDAFFNVSTLETFAIFTGLKDSNQAALDAGLVTESELAALVPSIRLGNQFGLNPAGIPGCTGVNCEGIGISSFVFEFLASQGVFPFGMDPTTAIPFILGSIQPRVLGFDAWDERVESDGTYESWAIYGDATWTLSEKMNLTVGARYTEDDKTFNLRTAYQNDFAGLPIGLAFFNNGQPILDASQTDDWSSLSGRVVLDYHLDDDVMVYGSIATGFKSGGFNSLNFGPLIDTSYDEEEVINYEIGMKGLFADGRLQVNSSLFFYEYDNLQELDLIGQPIPSYNLRNADAEGQGLEIDWQWQVTDQWFLGGNYGYLDTEYTRFNIIPAAGETASDDRTGEPRVDTPENKVNLNTEYVVPLEGGAAIAVRVDYTWVDERVGSIIDSSKVIDAYSLTNARVEYTSSNENIVVALWGTNIFDEEELINFGTNGEAIGSLSATRLTPRLYGVDLIYKF